MPAKEIYDNVYGFIGVNQLELEIIDHPLFQHLKNIRQLGMSYTVFSGAVHTRFSHSLGVMHLVDKIGTKLIDDSLITEDELLKLRLAALLHDIGHYPLSHTIETPMLKKNDDSHHKILDEYILNNFSISDEAPHSRGVRYLMSKTTQVALAFDCPNHSRAAEYDDRDKMKSPSTPAIGPHLTVYQIV